MVKIKITRTVKITAIARTETLTAARNEASIIFL
jgi:hypothetical protein